LEVLTRGYIIKSMNILGTEISIKRQKSQYEIIGDMNEALRVVRDEFNDLMRDNAEFRERLKVVEQQAQRMERKVYRDAERGNLGDGDIESQLRAALASSNNQPQQPSMPLGSEGEELEA